MVGSASEPKSLTASRKGSEDLWRAACGVCCLGIVCIILVTGLWPFHRPKNDVEWLQGENGLRLGHHGIVVSSAAFQTDAPEGGCTIEIYLRPAGPSGSGTILALDDNPEPKDVFAVRQFDQSLALQRPALDDEGKLVRQWWRTDGVFKTSQPLVLTVTSAEGKATLYIDGVAVHASSEFGLVNRDLTGKLVLGSSAIYDRWRGDILGVAIYPAALTATQVEQDSASWRRGLAPGTNSEAAPSALYRFDERNGISIHDQGPSRNSLLIRPLYFVLHPGFLTPVWDAYRSRWDGWRTWSYWSDVLVNIAGFVPFGFLFALWFSLMPAMTRPRLTALLLGILISLAIETLQYFLPTRDSSMTDLLNNSIGTALGVAMCRPALMRKISGQGFARSPAGQS